MIVVTLWPVARWREALPALKAIRPGAVMLHSDPATLERSGAATVRAMRAELGEAMPREVWLGVAFDIAARTTRAKIAAGDRTGALLALRNERMRAANAANEIGAPVVMLDPEAAWKLGAPGFDAHAAELVISDFRERCPGRRLMVTSFDCPGYHSALPWREFDGCDQWAPQVYAAPASGEPDPRYKAGEARLALHQRMWATATRLGWLKPRAPLGYVQAHHVIPRETLRIANAFDDVALWAFPTRADANGLLAARALAELERRGFAGAGRIEAFQRAQGLEVDGVAGRETLGRLLGA